MSATNRKTRLTNLMIAFLGGLSLMGCLTAPESMDRDATESRLSVGLYLERSSADDRVAFRTVVVEIASNQGDTLHDTITVQGSKTSRFPVRIDTSVGASHIIHPLYALDPTRAWTLTAKTLDGRDSVRHLASVQVQGMVAGQTRNITVKLAERFTSYTAVFPLPEKMTDGRTVRFQRLVLTVDGQPVCEKTAADLAQSPVLHCEYLPVGYHTIALSAQGQIQGEAGPRVLLKGQDDVAFSTTGTAESVTLGWVASSVTQTESEEIPGFEVRLSRVGYVAMDVRISGGIAL
jgi:hypothetical protein